MGEIKKYIAAIGLVLLFSCQSGVFKDKLPEILGISNVEIKDNHGTDEFGGFGEGYTLEIYELSESTVNSFIDRTSKILPDKKEKATWKKYDWQKTPVDSSYNEILIMSLNYSGGNKKLETELSEIKKVLEKPEVYYSFYYSPNKDNPQDAQFFVLDVQTGKLYVIESKV